MGTRTIRGAITTENTKETILADATMMLSTIIQKNGLANTDIVSMLFTCTKDLTAVYPAVAARGLGITEAGLMCMQELYIEGSLEKCIRVLVTIDSSKPQADMCHVYLKGAERLRPDLVNKGESK